MPKVVLITGCSSGIGLATAVFLAKKGNTVYAAMRDLGKKEKLLASAEKENVRLQVLQLDVTSDESVNKAVAEIVQKEGRIDVLVNNAGYGLLGPMETVTLEEAKAQFEVNFFGTVRVTKAVLPHMRKRKSGYVINLSSLAGVRGAPCMDFYNASKFAVEGLTEAMAPVMATLGIKVSMIEPGPIATNFLGTSLKQGMIRVGDYSKIIDKTIASLKERFANAQKPEEVAEVISLAISSEQPHLRYQTNESGRESVAAKLNDPTGDIRLKAQLENLKK